jgi:thiol-disulfide isomerase/thioredoxin
MTAFGVILVAICFLIVRSRGAGHVQLPSSGESPSEPHVELTAFNQGAGLSLKGGVDWINSGPISLSELRGKIVLLDFWTYCCINCHHIIPVLAKLEAKYKDELVVIGVHTAKFDAERDTENIRRKVAEYRIQHPVVNDANMTIWKNFHVQAWPTLVLIDANGRELDRASGEPNAEALDRVIGQLVEMHKAKKRAESRPAQVCPGDGTPHERPPVVPGQSPCGCRR